MDAWIAAVAAILEIPPKSLQKAPPSLPPHRRNSFAAPMNPTPPKFALTVDKGVATLYLYGSIGEWDVNVMTVLGQLEAAVAAGAERVNVRIHSTGGDVYEGYAIFNTLLQSRVPVFTFVDGVAASMASVIALAGQRVHMGRASLMMIHNPWTIMSGDAEALRREAVNLEQVEAQLAGIYARRTGKSEAEIRDMMKVETWLTAEEAVAQGFADEIVNSVFESALPIPQDRTNLRPAAAFALYIPSAPDAEPEPKLPPKPADAPPTQMQDNATVDARVRALREEILQADEAAAVAILNRLVRENQELQEQVAAQQVAQAQRKITDCERLVDDAVQQGQITDAQRGTYLALAQADFDATRLALNELKPKPLLSRQIQSFAKPGLVQKADWDWAKWSSEDPNGLVAMQTNDPERYRQLVAAHRKALEDKRKAGR